MAKDEVPSAPELPASESKIPKSIKITEPSDSAIDDTVENTETIPVAKEPESLPVSAEEQALLSASESMGIDQPDASAPKSPKPVKAKTKSGRSFKKIGIILVVLIVAAAICGAAWYFLVKEKPVSEPVKSSEQEQVTSQTKLSYTPDTLAYAFRTTSSDPFTMYYRPADGGDRKEATKLSSRDDYPATSDVYGATSIFVAGEAMYASTDNAKSYKKIITTESNKQIIDVKISADGKGIAYAVSGTEGGDKPSINFVDINGGNKKTLVKLEETANRIAAFNQSKQKIVYHTGCYACDGPSVLTGTKLYDIKTSKAQDLFSDYTLVNYNFTISDDFSTVIYIEDTADKNIKVSAPYEGEGAYYKGAPHTIKTMTLTDNKSTSVTSVGTKQEKNPNGTDKWWRLSTGFLAGSNVPYFSADKTVSVIKANKAETVVEFDKMISQIYFVDNKDVFVALEISESSSSDIVLNKYTIATEKVLQILEGDANTVIFGITTK